MEEQNNTEKTFTQDELNAIVGERVARERDKYEGFEEYKAKAEEFDRLEEANKSELQKATEEVATLKAQVAQMTKDNEVRQMRDKVSKESGIPANLLTADSEDECKAQAEAIKEFANPNYPSVKDGGEVQTPTNADTRTQFAEWANEAFS